VRVNPDDARGAALAAALVNTRPRPASSAEGLADAAAVAHVLGEHGVPAGAAEVARARDALAALRAALLAAFEAPDMAALARVLNPSLARAGAPRLARAEDGGWALRPGAATLADRVAAATARGLAAVALAHGVERLEFCSADDCQAVFADASTRGARRYCTRTCANRVNVRRHRT
jgi:predicted RNA-binding Zn ribbon-like protein